MSDTPVKHYEDIYAPKADGMEYMLTVGRRQAMHQGHLRTAEKIMEHGYKAIIVVGSTNTATKTDGFTDPLFEPLSNPLNAEQQATQIRTALKGKVEGKDYFIVNFPDVGNNERWCEALVDKLKGQIKIDGVYPDISGKTAFHFIGREEDKRPKRFATADGQEKEVLAYAWDGIFERLGLPVLEDGAHKDVGLEVSGTRLRKMDLNHLTPEQRSLFAAPDFVISEANRARQNNPDKDKFADIPVTAFDLSLERLYKEKHISTAQIVELATAKEGGTTLPNLISSARELNGSMKAEKTVRLKIASVSLNQTAYNFDRNMPNILAAIDMAAKRKVDVLSLEELGLTAYSADDYHQFLKSNESIWKHLQVIAEYAALKDPNLVISVGTPWHRAVSDKSADDPEFNIDKRPNNCQFMITQGKVYTIAAKSQLADGPAENEMHQFTPWPYEKGAVEETLPDGRKVPFGKPLLGLEVQIPENDTPGAKKVSAIVTIYNEQCAEGWNGMQPDSTVNMRVMTQARYLVKKAQTHDISVALNPSFSKPECGTRKEETRMELCRTGSKYAGAYIYTNGLGSASGLMAAEGSQIFAQNGEIIHHGKRYHFGDISYSDVVIDVPVATRGKPDIVAKHELHEHELKNTGGEAGFESVAKIDPRFLEHEEYARNRALWVRDYMEKQDWSCQGFVVSLSGGKDSAAVAIDVTNMVDLTVQDEGVEGFFKRFKKLKCKDEVLKIYKEKGQEAAVDAIKDSILTCVYLPTENSSERTLNAAKFLIEGGTIPAETAEDGMVIPARNVKGIGGKFYVAPKQRVLDEEVAAYAGLDVNRVARDNLDKIIESLPVNSAEEKEHLQKLPQEYRESIAQAHIIKTIRKYVDSERGSNPTLPDYIAKKCVMPIPTWANEADDGTLQNIQARIRLPTPWTVANKEGKIALVSSNKSESVLGYTTAGGDMHMGGANPLGGTSKIDVIDELEYMRVQGLHGMRPIESLYHVCREVASAELRKQEEGKAAQTDENDLGFSYAQSDRLEKVILRERNTPDVAFHKLRNDQLFPKDAGEFRDILVKFAHKQWAPNQFKRIGGMVSPYEGGNVDSEQSLRTPPLGDHFKTPLVKLTLDVMAEKLGGERQFETFFRMSLDDAKYRAEVVDSFKWALLGLDVDKMLTALRDPEHKAAFREIANSGPMAEALEAMGAAKNTHAARSKRIGGERHIG